MKRKLFLMLFLYIGIYNAISQNDYVKVDQSKVDAVIRSIIKENAGASTENKAWAKQLLQEAFNSYFYDNVVKVDELLTIEPIDKIIKEKENMISKLEKDKISLSGRISKLEKDKISLEKDIISLKDKISQLESGWHTLNMLNDSLYSQNRKLNYENRKLNYENRKLNDENRKLNDENRKLNYECEALELEIKNWKLKITK